MQGRKITSGQSDGSIMTELTQKSSRPVSKSSVKYLCKLPEPFQDRLYVYNLEEEKQKFLTHGILPKLRRKNEDVRQIEVHFEYLSEATQILDEVKRRYGDGENYMEHMYGERIDASYATNYLLDYIKENGAEGLIDMIWTPDLACSGKMTWRGPNVRLNRPEARRFCLWIKDSQENTFLRQKAIRGFAHHEIGTHYLRTLNDGMQPWFSSRSTFNLRSSKSHQTQITEEGLAAINTVIDTFAPLLFMPALLYYTACKATEMDFRELYNHLATYIDDREQRWKHVMRVKRTLNDCRNVGGTGNDQCYFRGAVDILRNFENIDFRLLYSGKICVDELRRVHRIARLSTIKLPNFMKDLKKYHKRLEGIAYSNGIRRKFNFTRQLRVVSRNKMHKVGDKQNSEKKVQRRKIDSDRRLTVYLHPRT